MREHLIRAYSRSCSQLQLQSLGKVRLYTYANLINRSRYVKHDDFGSHEQRPSDRHALLPDSFEG